MKRKLVLACLIFSVFAVCSVFAKDLMEPVTSGWKIKFGDDRSWASMAFSDAASWDDAELPGTIVIGDKGERFWIKTKVTVPQSLSGKDVYIELGRSTAALEIYIDGILMSTHGTIDPQFNISHVSNTLAYIPAAAIKNGSVEISIRCRAGATHVVFEQFYLVDSARYFKTKLYQNFLNNTVYYMMAAICMFIGLYFLFQFFSDNREKSSRSFSIMLFTVSVYFFDMATGKTFIQFIWQLTLARFCLLCSIACLSVFICQFFKRPYKLVRSVAYVILLVVAAAYIYSTRSLLLSENVFTFSLLPIFGGIIFMFVIVIKEVIAKSKNAKKILVGISIALLFGVHDIVYQIRGEIPFAWLQGFAFFFIDATMFFVVAVENIQNKQKISEFIDTTSQQRDKLNEVLNAAAKLSAETMEISAALDDSVLKVAESVDLSVKEAGNIADFINKQNVAVKSTSVALGELVSSVRTVNGEVQTETSVMSEAVEETKLMIDGVNQVADAISATAEFSSSLGNLAKTSENDVAQLVEAMETIKNSSSEILGVVQIVTDFAQQTNMLAMNASIEAAHAGISGKGFAVIAHEIKNLAAASSTQADKIKDIVTVIDSNIGTSFDLSLRVKDVLAKVSKEAVDSSTQINESVQSMQIQKQAGKRISEATATMSASALNVKRETDQQYSYSQMASSNMTELSDFAERAQAAVSDINVRNRQLSEQTAALQQLAHRAKDAAEGLNKLIAK